MSHGGAHLSPIASGSPRVVSAKGRPASPQSPKILSNNSPVHGTIGFNSFSSSQSTVSTRNSKTTGNNLNVSTSSSKSLTGLVLSNRVDPLILAELATTQKLLSIQQKDNYRFQDHTRMLDGEIDALKEVLEQKQLIINKKEDEIDQKVEQVRNLEMELKAARLDIASFNSLTDKFRSVSGLLESKQIEFEELTKTLAKVEKNRDEMESYWQSQIQASLVTEAKLTASIGILENNLAELQEKKSIADARIAELSQFVSDLQQELKFCDETRQEQVCRSRQTEYKTLLKVDTLAEKLQTALDEREQVQNTLELSLFRGDVLQSRLSESFTVTEENHKVMETVVKALESANAEARVREKMLIKENELLQARLVVAQKAVVDLSHRLVYAPKGVGHAPNGVALSEENDSMPTNNEQLAGDISANTARSTKLSSKEPSQGLFPKLGGDIAVQSPSNRSRKGTNTAAVSQDFDRRGSNRSSKARTRQDETMGLSSTMGNRSSKSLGGSNQDEVRPRTVAMSAASSGGVFVVGEEIQLRGKSQLITKHMQYFDICVKNGFSLGCELLDMSSMGLLDSEMKIITEQLRTLSMVSTKKIDLRRNLLSAASIEMLALWIIALSGDELQRGIGPLEIDMRYNMISPLAIQRAVSLIRSMPRPEIALTTAEEDFTIVYLYGPSDESISAEQRRPTSSGRNIMRDVKANPSMRLLIRIDLRHNEIKKRPPKIHRLNATGPAGTGNVDMPHSKVLDDVDIRPVAASRTMLPGGSIDSRDWEKSTANGVVFPRDTIIRDKS